MSASIEWGVTHCAHCERPFASNDTPDGDERYCPGNGACVTFEEAESHLIAVLRERDALRREVDRTNEICLDVLRERDALRAELAQVRAELQALREPQDEPLPPPVVFRANGVGKVRVRWDDEPSQRAATGDSVERHAVAYQEIARLHDVVHSLAQENNRLRAELQAYKDDPAKALREIPEAAQAYDAAPATCAVCGSELEHVRPGKWQCNVCEAQR